MLLLNVWVLKQQLIKLLVFFTMEAVWDLSAFLITITVPLVQPLPKIFLWQVEQPQLLLMINKFC